MSTLVIGLTVITILAKTKPSEVEKEIDDCTGCDKIQLKEQIEFIDGITLPVLLGIMATLVIKMICSLKSLAFSIAQLYSTFGPFPL